MAHSDSQVANFEGAPGGNYVVEVTGVSGRQTPQRDFTGDPEAGRAAW